MKHYFFLLVIILVSCSSARYQREPAASKRASLDLSAPIRAKKAILAPPWKTSRELIVIDAGHGGEDMGTCSLSTPKYEEKSLALSTAVFLKTYLQQMGFRVKMTRIHDSFVALDKRSFFANENKSQLFVSIHYNSAPSKEAKGIEIYYFKSGEDKKRSDQSRFLAESVLKRMIGNTDAHSRGVKHANFSVIRETKMPAILIEGGFMTNQSEMERIKDPAYLKRLAWGIAQGIDDYVTKRAPAG